MGFKPILTGDKTNEQVKLNGNTGVINKSPEIDNAITSKVYEKSKSKPLDPQGIIPNGIYKVFLHERNLKKFNVSFATIIFIAALTISLLFGFMPKWFNPDKSNENWVVPWIWYVLPVLAMVISLPYLIIESIEWTGINKSENVYRENIRHGDLTPPPFIPLLYQSLVKKQVRRTWLIIALIFYIGLATLIIYILQLIQNREFLTTKKWLDNAFNGHVNEVIYSLCGIMGGILLLFIINTILRKRRMVDIQSFFGSEVMNYTKFQEDKANCHKFWAKIFFISVLVTLVLPIIIYLIVKRIRKNH